MTIAMYLMSGTMITDGRQNSGVEARRQRTRRKDQEAKRSQYQHPRVMTGLLQRRSSASKRWVTLCMDSIARSSTPSARGDMLASTNGEI